MVSAFLLLTLAGASGGTAREVVRIDSACSVAIASRANKARPRIFVETSGAVMPQWRQGESRELDSEAELHALSESERPPNTEAIVRRTRGGTLVSMYLQDASASWAHVMDYCFESGGRLVRLAGTYNSFAPAQPGDGIRRRRVTYFDAAGAVLRMQTRVFDIDTDSPLAAPNFLDEDDPVYPSLRALPFSNYLLPPAPPVELAPDELASRVREQLPSVRSCYDRAVRRTPGLAGKAVARWTVDVAGKVTGFAWQSDELKSPLFASCAQKVIEGLQFPARDVPAVVSFPFVFGGPDNETLLSPPPSRGAGRRGEASSGACASSSALSCS